MSAAGNSDVVIVGGGLGGLSAAIHLRLAGLGVTLLEAGRRVGGRANLIEREGFRFDTGPSLLNYPWVFEELFAAARRDFHKYVRLLPVDSTITFRWEDGTRFTLSSDVHKFLGECERLEPGCGPAVFNFLKDAGAKFRVAFDKLVTRNVDGPAKWLGALSLSELRRTSLWRSFDGELRRGPRRSSARSGRRRLTSSSTRSPCNASATGLGLTEGLTTASPSQTSPAGS